MKKYIYSMNKQWILLYIFMSKEREESSLAQRT